MLTALAMAAALTSTQPCDGTLFFQKMDQVALYRVRAPGRTRFLSAYAPDGRECGDDRPCALQAYLVTGDVVAVSHQRKGYACAWFKPAPKSIPRGKRKVDPIDSEGPSTLAWLPLSALEPVAIPAGRPASTWNGQWVGESQLLDIVPKGEARLIIKGVAYYAQNEEAVERGSTNTGEIDGLYVRDGDRAEGTNEDEVVRRTRPADFGDDFYDCALRMRLVGGYLLVLDNNRCGGLNVTFSGIYRRDPPL